MTDCVYRANSGRNQPVGTLGLFKMFRRHRSQAAIQIRYIRRQGRRSGGGEAVGAAAPQLLLNNLFNFYCSYNFYQDVL